MMSAYKYVLRTRNGRIQWKYAVITHYDPTDGSESPLSGKVHSMINSVVRKHVKSLAPTGDYTVTITADRFTGRILSTDVVRGLLRTKTKTVSAPATGFTKMANEFVAESTVKQQAELISKLKPSFLQIPKDKFAYLVRNVMRNKNTMIIGHQGSGKTTLVYELAKLFTGRTFEKINLGSTQDPRTTLIGRMGYDPDSGTKFHKSDFVMALMKPGAIILLDELSRAHPEAWNILLPVLDGQRYIRIEELAGTSEHIIEIAEGVTFIATANVGNKFTATRKLDAALTDRFMTLEMPVLDMMEEYTMLSAKFTPSPQLRQIAEVAHETRMAAKGDKMESFITSRMTVEAAELVLDGYSVKEAIEFAILPNFNSDVDGDQAFILKLMQSRQIV
jgi:MoxR-like ATPase